MSKKKVILYNPKAVFFDMPLALLAIGTQIEKDFEVVIIDARIEKDVEAIVNQHIDDTVLVGVTSLTGAPLLDAIEFSKLVKEKNNSLVLVWGGWHTSLFPNQVLEEIPQVDIAVQGQGELTFKEIANSILVQSDYRSIKGLSHRENGKVIKNPPRSLENVNHFERVNYDLIDVEKYFKAKGTRQFDYISSVGCFFRCKFCADPFVFDRNFSGLEPDRVVQDLIYYHEKYQFTDLNFQDETFFTYSKKIIKMAEGLIDYGSQFTWAATLRADQGSRMSFEDFKTCKNSGLRRLLIGVESGSQEMMDLLNKDIKLEQVFQCADWCEKLGIGAIFPFIVGFPNETDEQVEESKKVIRRLAGMTTNFDTPIFYFKPYPGTQITIDAVKKGEYVLPKTIREWAKFDYIGSKGPWVSEEKYKLFEAYKFYLKLYKKRESKWVKPLNKLVQWRLKRFNFGFSLEKVFIERVITKNKLS